MSSVQPSLDAAGRRRSPATTPGCRIGIAPCNKGQRYPADPPTVDEIVAVMRQAGRDRHGHRLSALIVVLWRAGLRINEALSLTETDLDQGRGSILVGAKRRLIPALSARWRSSTRAALADHARPRVGPSITQNSGPTERPEGGIPCYLPAFVTSRAIGVFAIADRLQLVAFRPPRTSDEGAGIRRTRRGSVGSSTAPTS